MFDLQRSLACLTIKGHYSRLSELFDVIHQNKVNLFINLNLRYEPRKRTE